MKLLRVLFITATALIGQQICAEKFQIQNHLPYGVEVIVSTTNKYWPFHATIPGNTLSDTIDIGNDNINYIEWIDGDSERKAIFDEYKQSNGKIPLQKTRKNFFNIRPEGQYYHNFGGKIIYGQSIN